MKGLVLGAPEIYTGPDSLQSLQKVKMSRAFIVTGGKSMFQNGAIDRIAGMLEGMQCASFIFSGVGKNPDTQIVLNGLAAMREFAPDTVIAVGGGSPLDAAKVMALMYEYPELTFETALSAPLPAKRKRIRFVAIPSTSGTGSEVTKSAVITFHDQEFKIGLRTTAFVPDVAILDPELTMSMPPNLVAETGMDAMTHAVESYLNPNADEFTTTLSMGAIEGILTYLPASYHENTLAAREKMHYYQCMAGIAFANCGLGAVHGIAHALGGKFNMAHGLLNAIALPYVLRFNSQDQSVAERLARLAYYVRQPDIVTAIEDLNSELSIPDCLQAAGIAAERFIEALSLLISNSLRGPTAGNPVHIDVAGMERLLCEIYWGKEK